MIKLTKDKIVYSNQYNPDSDEYIEKEVSTLQPYLNEVVELSDDFILDDLFHYIEKEKDFFNSVFSSQLGHFPLNLFISDWKKDPKEKDKDIRYLEIYRWIEQFEYDGEIDLEISEDFGGIGIDPDHPDGGDISWGVGFSSISEIKHLPLRLNKECRLGSVLGNVTFTVYDLIGVILFEISFYGPPDHRDEVLEKVVSDVEEIKKGMKEDKTDGDENGK